MRILVVEDDFLLAEQLAFEIRQLGDEVVGPFSSIACAARSVGVADAAILDVRIREGTSFPIADKLKANSTPFVFLTGYSSHIVPDRFDKTRFYSKPSPTRTLLADLHRQHGGARPEPTLEMTVRDMMIHARCHIPDEGAAERLVETILRRAIAEVEADRPVRDMHEWLLSCLREELARRHRIHMH